MKRKFAILLSFIVFAFAFTSCNSNEVQNTVSEEIGIDVSSGSELSSSDTHGGFHGDGVSCTALQFSDDTVLEEIKNSSNWKEFPLDETVQAIVYGISEDTYSIGPYLTDDEGNAIVPDIQNGYYLLIDRQIDQEMDILSRASFNLTVALYDTDTNILYICELDT